jgi:choline-glycine betaine transporter
MITIKFANLSLFVLREVLNITGDFMQELQENNITCYFKKKEKTYNSLFYWKSWVSWS